MAELNVSLVAIDRSIWSGTATSVSAMTLDGSIGILPRHEPVLALLADHPVKIVTTDGETVVAAVHGGFFAVDSDNVEILADEAVLASEIDVAHEQQLLSTHSADSDDPHEAATARRAAVRLSAADF